MSYKVQVKIGGKDLVFETGKIARQANASVMGQYEGTVVLASAVMAKEESAQLDFLPLTIEYRERSYAAGKIPGGFFKREGRPRDKEIVTSRLIDRPLRPLLPPYLRYEIQNIITVLSFDQENPPDVLSMNALFTAMFISNIPLTTPLAAIRVGWVEGQFICNPTYGQLEQSRLDLVVAATPSQIIMIEGEAKEISSEVILAACQFAEEEVKKIFAVQEELWQKCGQEKLQVSPPQIDAELEKSISQMARDEIKEANEIPEKIAREQKIDALIKKCKEKWPEEFHPQILSLIKKIEREEVRRLILEEKRRVDKRGFNEIRPISCEISVLPRAHGSALFSRGQTQALAVTTLGSSVDEQILDDLEGESSKTFMLHYNFPPFSTGDIKPLRGPGRREIGHGNLAERALKPVIPDKEKFPYTIRIVSDILESNGSSSMASVCGSTLSLMDAGVPITAPVAGVALGLVKEQDKTVVLSDITGLEDHIGDMDFKVAGTLNGITAIQMDLKIEGIDLELMKKILVQAEENRKHILEKMMAVIDKPKKDLSQYAPRIISFPIKKEKIREVIGPGGKTIRGIIEETGVVIDIKDDEGMVFIFSTDPAAAERAKGMIEYLTQEIEVGKIYLGKVLRTTNFGAFVEIAPGKEGLVHISQLAEHHVRNVEDVVKIGDEVLVKVTEIDELGRISLSRKQALRERRRTTGGRW